MDNNAQLIAVHRQYIALALFLFSLPGLLVVILFAEPHFIPTGVAAVVVAWIIYREEKNFDVLPSATGNSRTLWRITNRLEKEDSTLSKQMRAKMVVDVVRPSVDGSPEHIEFRAVSKDEPYGDDGKDENNTFALYTPSARATFQINNPELFGQYKEGQAFYVDFTPAD